VLTAFAAEVFGPWGSAVSFRLMYPFVDARPALPIQRLGQAAGLPAPGPLGIQIHPIYGPWWAYRAVVVLSEALVTEPVLATSCPGCARPCADACPAGAVTAMGFSYERCGGHRMVAPVCRDSCAARIACPVGSAHGYPAHQLAFHMRASMWPRDRR
jgi:epoxyqueuosine reductase